MKYKKIPAGSLFIITLLIFISSCNEREQPRAVDPAFYYWKSVWQLSPFEEARLDGLHVKTIYIKFFDIEWDEPSRSPRPVAKLRNTGYTLKKDMFVIPTVFITNECMQKMEPSKIGELANNIYSLTLSIIEANGFNSIAEIQFDCDWTASSKDNYFSLLATTRSLWNKTKIPLSATIRLYQVKFLARAGTPPVDKGLLMCYNMGNLKDPATSNSIIEADELKKYTGNLSGYPLPLDVAFPLFSWKVLFRNNSYSGLIQDLPDSIFKSAFAKQRGNRFEIWKDTLLQGYELRNGDIIRSEQSTVPEILAAADEVKHRLKNTRPRVSLYHLDSVILNKYSIHELESIYCRLR